MISTYDIRHFSKKKQFVINIDGQIAYVEYVETPNSLDIIHTIVPQLIEGQGVAAALVKTAYDYAKNKKLKLLASCSYAKKWLEKHPEY